MAHKLTIDRPNRQFAGKDLIDLFEARGHVVKQVSQNLTTGEITIETVDDVDTPAQALLRIDIDARRNRIDWS